MTVLAVLVLAAGTFAFRLAGPMLRSRFQVPEHVQRLLSLAAVSLLAALIATAALTKNGEFVGCALPAGVGVGALAAWRRLPFVVVVALAAATTAGLRIAGVR